MAKKFTIKKVKGVRIATECRKNHNRAPCPSPEIPHKSIRDYDRHKNKRNLKKEIEESL